MNGADNSHISQKTIARLWEKMRLFQSNWHDLPVYIGTHGILHTDHDFPNITIGRLAHSNGAHAYGAIHWNVPHDPVMCSVWATRATPKSINFPFIKLIKRAKAASTCDFHSTFWCDHHIPSGSSLELDSRATSHFLQWFYISITECQYFLSHNLSMITDGRH